MDSGPLDGAHDGRNQHSGGRGQVSASFHTPVTDRLRQWSFTPVTRLLALTLSGIQLAALAGAQDPSTATQNQSASAPQEPSNGSSATNVADAPERWNLFFQATSIGDAHDSFHAAYSGPLSLSNHSEYDVSLTSTVFLGLRLTNSTRFYVDPEIAGGRGFSGVDGIANSPNGELPRVATATPKPYLARAYLVQDFSGFGDGDRGMR